MAEVAGLAALAAFIWLWHDSLKARESCLRASRAACAAEHLLLLDDTVAVRSLWPARDDDGRLRIKRVYAFEFSDTGNNRRSGAVTLIGERVIALHIDRQPQ